MKQIIPGLYTFTGLVVGRVYLIEDPDGLTIIDAGVSLAPERIVKQLVKAGRKASDVKRILITHAHPDHVGGLPELKKLTGANVIASPFERSVIEGRRPIPGPPPEKLPAFFRVMRPPRVKLKPTVVDREVRDGELLQEVMGGLNVVSTPGHAPGHVAFWQPEKGVLFCGDVMMNLRGLRLPPRMVTVDMEENKRSIGKVADLDAKLVCFGHGQPLVENAAKIVRRFARKMTPA